MTTRVSVEPAGHHVMVIVTDEYPVGSKVVASQTLLQPAGHWVDGTWVPTGQGVWSGYATTTRSIYALDLEPNDPRVLEASGRLNCPVT